ncbi:MULTISPECIES: polyhydroxyalkanoate synthesis repressor PhaR [Alteromonadaceae]|uniref:Polyhydroxyalkanoate synthesis repressor PhaR n=1 Tax=Brumicola blandensis TaxID=3075611 RepID=A0AAW8QYQ1_9ALTE|nr:MULTISPECIES: polyhydroxyalkanoate synthesis repressor PhaR [unclassified Alteromonas]MDT0582288.1 polyhydroxyalkanoate synthesis repressor PhaR [Alteromonas sp. W409]MDT0628509.1 polyhydroxyalkanoate synthesis repressor PhaR [Alteromonas sp. W364]
MILPIFHRVEVTLVVIKKYPNRRLYDSSQSKYVNLDFIKVLINDRVEFKIVDSKTDADLTKSVLLQIISESETNEQQSLLTDVLLKQLIRFYDSDMEVFVRQYLEQSIVQFIEQQDKVQGLMKNMVDNSPIGMFSKIMEQNMSAWNMNPQNKKDS